MLSHIVGVYLTLRKRSPVQQKCLTLSFLIGKLAMYESLSCSAFLLAYGLVKFFGFSHSNRLVVVSLCGVIYISLVTNDINHFSGA